MGKVLFFIITAMAAVCAGERAGALVWHFARPEFFLFMGVGVAGHFMPRPTHGLILSLLAGAGAIVVFSPSGIPWGAINSFLVLIVSQLFWRLSEQEKWGSAIYGRIPTNVGGVLLVTAMFGLSFGPVIAVMLALQAIKSANPQLKVAACAAALLGGQNPLTNPLLGGRWPTAHWVGLLVFFGVVGMFCHHLLYEQHEEGAGKKYQHTSSLPQKFLNLLKIFVGLQVATLVATTAGPLPRGGGVVIVWAVFGLVALIQLDQRPRKAELAVIVRGPLGFASLGLVGWAFVQSAGKFQVGGLELFLIPLFGGWFSSGALSAVMEAAPGAPPWVGWLLPLVILLSGSLTRIGDMTSWVTNTQLTPQESREWLKGRFLATQASVMLAWVILIGYFFL